MSNSSLVKVTKLSPNMNTGRNHAIDTITIHCVAGHMTAQSLGDWFAKATTQASSNYGVDDLGVVGMYVEEKDRSWCTSSATNDNRAVTIEVASDSSAPYKVTDAALTGVIELCADICKRNNIKKLLWKGDKNIIGQISKQNMTVHRWFKNKSCPGDFLYEKHPEIVEKVNQLLTANCQNPDEKPKPPTNLFQEYKVKINTGALNYRKEPDSKSASAGFVYKNEVYTIVKESDGPGASKWGKLKSGAGWISLDYVVKLN
jgi:hypothetical protein